MYALNALKVWKKPKLFLEPEMWGTDQQFHSSFPLEIYEPTF